MLLSRCFELSFQVVCFPEILKLDKCQESFLILSPSSFSKDLRRLLLETKAAQSSLAIVLRTYAAEFLALPEHTSLSTGREDQQLAIIPCWNI